MKVLKYIGYGLLALLILFIILAFVLPTKHHISVEETINAPKAYVFNAINDMRAHENWSPWKSDDPEMTMTMGDRVVGPGAYYTWESEKNGTGKYTIQSSDIDQGIKTLVEFGKRGSGNGSFDLVGDGDKTKATWSFDFESGRFMNVFMPIMSFSMKRTFRKGLNNIDKLLQTRIKEGSYFGYPVKESVGPIRFFSTKRSVVQEDKSQQFYAANLGQLFTSVQASGVKVAGKPCALIYNFLPRENKVDMAAAIPLGENLDFEGASLQTIQAGPIAYVEYTGDYKGISKAHEAIQSYLTDREMNHNWPIIEEFVTDDTVEEDKRVWRIIYPLAK